VRFFRDLLGGAAPYDVAVRTSRTFLQTFGSTLIISGALDLGLDSVEAAALGGGAAALAVLMGFLTPAS
jgi:hypothetical protein